MTVALGIVKSLRPHQWVKNLFVAAPLIFARHLLDAAYVWRAGVAVAIFCLLSGAVYLFNDVRDVQADRAHPVKKARPIAAGQVNERTALVASGVFAAVALAAAFWLTPWFALAAGGYLANNLLYTLWGKEVAFIDVAMITLGFLVRVYAGALAIDVPVSQWLLVNTATLAFLLGLGKRAHELAWALRTTAAAATRAALAGYRLSILRPLMVVLAIATSVAYVGYTRDPHTVAFFGTKHLVFTAPFPVLGILRYLDLALWHPKRESPTDAMLKDPWFLSNLVAWATVVVWVVYGNR